MSEEKYKPSAEEINEAGENMSERQKDLTESREQIIKSLEECGLSEKTIFQATVGKEWGTLYVNVNNHRIGYNPEKWSDDIHGVVTIDEMEVLNSKDRSNLKEIVELIHKFDSLKRKSFSPREAILLKDEARPEYQEYIKNLQTAMNDIFQ